MLAIFLKYPAEGKVKTRLGKTIGMAAACRIYGTLIKELYNKLKKYNPVIYSADRLSVPKFKHVFSTENVYAQKGVDLGERMLNVVRVCEQENEPCVIIGGDIPDIEPCDIDLAFRYLSEGYECVIGPADDGGYYLIAMKKPLSFVFKNIEWGTEKVFQATIGILENNGISYKLLEEKTDLDTYEDLIKLKLEHLLDI